MTRGAPTESLEELREVRSKREAELTYVRELLERADRRRQEDPANARRWNRVLDNLEAALDEAKARLTQSEEQVRAKKRYVEETGPDADHATPDYPSESLSPETAVSPQEKAFERWRRQSPRDPANAAACLLAAPFDAIGDLPLEAIALAQTYLASQMEHDEGPSENRMRLAARIEVANQGKPGRLRLWKPKAHEKQDRRSQMMLRKAIEKLETDRIRDMTIEEINFAINCFLLLCQRMSADAGDERLKRILERGMARIDQECARIRRLLAEKDATAPDNEAG